MLFVEDYCRRLPFQLQTLERLALKYPVYIHYKLDLVFVKVLYTKHFYFFKQSKISLNLYILLAKLHYQLYFENLEFK